MAENEKKAYICAVGLDSAGKRMEPGDEFKGSKKSLPWLVDQGHVVEKGSDAHDALKAALEQAELENEVAGDGNNTEGDDDA